MVTLMATVFTASLLGSLHCAGMCGSLMAVCVGLPGWQSGGSEPGRRWASEASRHLAYHGGRLVIYVLLGCIAGSVGASLDIASRLVGFQRGAAIAAGGLMVLIGAAGLLRCWGMAIPSIKLPAAVQQIVTLMHHGAMTLRPVPRAALIGLCSGLLPCGWLHVFTVTAMGTADPCWGAAVMAVFWLGTLPVLLCLGVSLQTLAGLMGRRVPLLLSVLIVAMGFYTVAGRLHVRLDLPDRSSQPVSTAGAIERLQTVDAADAPCCKKHGQ